MRRRTLLVPALAVALVFAVSGCADVRTVTESEVIPFKTVKRDDPSLFVGQSKVVQPGDQGLRTVVFEETYRWGKKLSRKKVKVETVFKPSEAVLNVGTKKDVVLSVQTAAGAFEIKITAAARRTPYVNGRSTISDAVVIKGAVTNKGTRTARTGAATDLALVHPAIRGGMVILPTSPPASVAPGQSLDVTWAASVNAGRPGANAALVGLSDLKITPRAFIGPRNSVIGETQAIDGLPSI